MNAKELIELIKDDPKAEIFISIKSKEVSIEYIDIVMQVNVMFVRLESRDEDILSTKKRIVIYPCNNNQKTN